jgi:hypothetical protein
MYLAGCLPYLPDLIQPSARMTNRLRAALQALGLATGGEGGAWLARQHRDAGSTHNVAAVPARGIDPIGDPGAGSGSGRLGIQARRYLRHDFG